MERWGQGEREREMDVVGFAGKCRDIWYFVLSTKYRGCRAPALLQVAMLLAFAIHGASADDGSQWHGGVTHFVPTASESQVAERFRLAEHQFQWQTKPLWTATENLEAFEVTFPSPVKTPEEPNNTVHCEYYRSLRGGKRPGVIVLHILGGDFPLSRLFCNVLAQHGVNALFVKMPYYGPRRDPSSPRRMVSPDPRQTVEGMTQAVLDIRRATAWLASRPEVDANRIGIFGISLGGITAALAATAEPRLKNVCLMLAGGDIGQAGWDANEARAVREQWLAQGGTREQFCEILRPVDPVTYAATARGKRILMLNAASDEVIPRACTDSLWKALGEPEIRWYTGGHYSVIRHLFSALLTVGQFFAKE
jgi:dienelactone hydrolase